MLPVAALHQGEPGQWPGWKIHRPAYCFASVTVWTENKKNVAISDRFCLFYFDSKKSAALVACVMRATTKKDRQFFRKKVHPRENPGYAHDSGWPGLGIFWPRNDLAPLLRWCRHWMLRLLPVTVLWIMNKCYIKETAH